MTKTIREQRRVKFLELLDANGLTRTGAADLLHVTPSAVDAWLKPETSKSSNPTPMWAIELLTFKMRRRRHGPQDL
jgi:predicted transcriptional regulator